jgi:plastocyanin
MIGSVLGVILALASGCGETTAPRVEEAPHDAIPRAARRGGGQESGRAAQSAPARPRRPAKPAGSKPNSRAGRIVGLVGKAVLQGDPVAVFLAGAKGLPRTHSLKQQDMRFVPTSAVVGIGDSMSFPNLDKVSHNVFAVSRVKSFDLGLFNVGDKRAVTFDRPGVIDVFCNIHVDMHATIVVVPSARYALVGSDGSFRLDDVAPGRYEVIAWKKGKEVARGRVTVRAASDAVIELGR